MNDTDWDQLIACTVFLPPATIEGLAERYGNAVLFPPTIRGTIAIFPEAKGQPAKLEGFPVFAGGAWHSLWRMRPSRIACNVARGLERGDGASDKHPAVCCTNGRSVEWPSWTPHHVYGFEGLKRDAAALNGLRFSNTANLVLIEGNYRRRHSVLDSEPVAAWPRYIISKLYPKAARVLGPAAEQPPGSPGEGDVNIAVEIAGALQRLVALCEQEPAGSAAATCRWREARWHGRRPPVPHSEDVVASPEVPRAGLTEDVFPQPSLADRRQSAPSSTTPTVQELINALPANLQRVYLEMQKRAIAFGPHVELYATRKNLVFKAGKMFAEIQRRKSSLRVLIRPEGFNIPENTTARVHGVTVTRVPDTHSWTVNHKLEVDGSSPMSGVEKLLRQSFQAVVAEGAGRTSR